MTTTPELKTFVEATHQISKQIDTGPLLATLVELARRHSSAQRVFVLLNLDLGETRWIPLDIAVAPYLAAEAGVCGPSHIYDPARPVRAEDDLPHQVFALAWRGGDDLRDFGLDAAVHISAPAQDTRIASDAYVQARNPGAIFCGPLRHQQAVHGLLYLEKPSGQSFDLLQVQMAQILCGQAAIALENAWLYARVREEMTERQNVERLLRAIAEGTAAVTGSDFFPLLVRCLANAFDVRKAFVTECTDTSMARVRTLAVYENHRFAANEEYEVADTPCEVVLGGSLVYYPEKLAEHFSKEYDESYLGAPLRDSQGRILGHLAVMDDKPMQRGPRELSILEIFSARACVELERKRAEDALLQSRQELQILNQRLEEYNRNLEHTVIERTHEIERRRRVSDSLREMLMVLNSNRSLDEILDYVIDAATRLLGAQSGAIFGLQSDGVTLAVQAARGLPPEYVAGLRFPLQRSFMGRAVVTGQPVIIPDLPAALAAGEADIEPWRQEILGRLYHTLLAVPLMREARDDVAGEIFGGIALYYQQESTFSEEEIRLSVAYGAQAALAIENRRLHRQAEMAAIIHERSRLARELHDSVTQSLYSLTLLAEGWRRMARAGRLENVDEVLAELGQIGQQALKEMRLLVYELRPPDLEKEGLLGALYSRLGAVEKRAGIDVRLVAGEIGDLPPAHEEALYRVALEALNNALKHARALTVHIRLTRTDGTDSKLILEVEDDGVGFDPHKRLEEGEGLGLPGMAERMRQLGGDVKVRSVVGAGTTIRAWLPVMV